MQLLNFVRHQKLPNSKKKYNKKKLKHKSISLAVKMDNEDHFDFKWKMGHL